MVKNTDLHAHSYYSDGLSSPRQLVRLAKKRKIKNLALTDHDSVNGIREAISEGKKLKVNIIPGVEVRCNHGEILGYYVDFKNKELIKKLKESAKRHEGKTREWCKKLKKAGYDVSFKEIEKKFPKSKGNLNTFYILYMLYKKGYGTTMDIARDIINDKRLAPKKIKKMTTVQAIRLVKKANGVPVLAHPWIEETKKGLYKIKSYVRAGLKGIELDNGDRAPFKPKQMNKRIKNIAKKYNLILTKGSDYHGEEIVKQMPGNHNLGKSNCDEKIVNELRKLSG